MRVLNLAWILCLMGCSALSSCSSDSAALGKWELDAEATRAAFNAQLLERAPAESQKGLREKATTMFMDHVTQMACGLELKSGGGALISGTDEDPVLQATWRQDEAGHILVEAKNAERAMELELDSDRLKFRMPIAKDAAQHEIGYGYIILKR